MVLQGVKKRRLVFLAVAIAVAALSAALIEYVAGYRRAARESGCHKHLMMIGGALRDYHDVHGCFPPAYTTDRLGKPMHSWRVLLLPYVEEEKLYARYNLNEPWNSPNNRLLAALMPDVYRCPSDTDAGQECTSYLAVVGAHAAWRPDRAVGRSDIKDGLSQTIMLIEVADSGVHWMEPRDLSFDEAAAGVNSGSKVGIRSRHSSVVYCGMGDASSSRMEKSISPTLLRGLLTADGGEDMSEFCSRL